MFLFQSPSNHKIHLNSQCGDVTILSVRGAVTVDVRAGGRAILVGRAGCPIDHALEEGPDVDSGNRPLPYMIKRPLSKRNRDKFQERDLQADPSG